MISIRRDSRSTFTRISSRSNTNYYCCVGGCRNNQRESKLAFFSLPKDAVRRTAWLKVIGRNDLQDKTDFTNYKVCSKHFTRATISEWFARILLPDAMPTKYLPRSRINVRDLKREDGFADAATQTEITYGSDLAKVKVETGMFNDYFERPSTSKAGTSRDFVIPNLHSFMMDSPPVKRKSRFEREEKENKKRRY